MYLLIQVNKIETCLQNFDKIRFRMIEWLKNKDFLFKTYILSFDDFRSSQIWVFKSIAFIS
jgi:hypothetical protein